MVRLSDRENAGILEKVRHVVGEATVLFNDRGSRNGFGFGLFGVHVCTGGLDIAGVTGVNEVGDLVLRRDRIGHGGAL